MVALVGAEVLAQFVDAGGKQRNLDFGRTGVLGAALEGADDLALRSVDSAIGG